MPSSLSSNMPMTQTAIVQGEGGTLTINHRQPVPSPDPHQVLVQVAAVAINPCDIKMPIRFPCEGAVDGCDFSGRVVSMGSIARQQSPFKIGDRVFGAVHRSAPTDKASGSFAEYVAMDYRFLFKTPSRYDDETAAAIGGTGLGTLGLAFYKSLGLVGTPDSPVDNGPIVLVYGGSTSVGTLALQLLRL